MSVSGARRDGAADEGAVVLLACAGVEASGRRVFEDDVAVRPLKTCTTCHQAKPPEEFFRNQVTADGRRNECKACVLEHQRVYRAAKRDGRKLEPKPMPERALRRGETHPNWKGAAVDRNAARLRAHRVFPVVTPCIVCGDPRAERHHDNGDTLDNRPENIVMLCRRCHMKRDGRLDALRALPHPGPQPPTPCGTCGRLTKPSWRGRCRSCYDYWYVHGKDKEF